MLFQTAKLCGIATILAVGAVGTLVIAEKEKTIGRSTPPKLYIPTTAREH